MNLLRLAVILIVLLCIPATKAWDYANHRLITELALASLPAEFPGFVRETNAVERILFLSGEADRWRNSPDLPLRHLNHPDHFFDFEYVEELGLKIDDLSIFRYSFAEQLLEAHKRHPGAVPLGPPGDPEQTAKLIGFLPWAITENYAKLKSSFSYLKAFDQLGSPEEIANARQNIIYMMGLLAHFPGDGSQPLHTTKHYNGWVGPNPSGYTTNRWHAFIDGNFLEANPPRVANLKQQLRPARLLERKGGGPAQADVFAPTMEWLQKQHAQVLPLYELEKAGKLRGENPDEGLCFLETQLVSGAQFLGDLWLTAWSEAQPDRFLLQYLRAQRK